MQFNIFEKENKKIEKIASELNISLKYYSYNNNNKYNYEKKDKKTC